MQVGVFVLFRIKGVLLVYLFIYFKNDTASGRANAKCGRAHLWWDRLSLNSVASRTWHCAIVTHCELIGSIEQHLNPYNSPVLATHMGPALPRLAMGQMRLAGSKVGVPSTRCPAVIQRVAPPPSDMILGAALLLRMI